jgi:hypothetical protein
MSFAQPIPRDELIRQRIGTGECTYVTETKRLIKTYFEKNNLSFDTFIEMYPNHSILFDDSVSNYDKLWYMSNRYDELEKNINSMRLDIMRRAT